MSNITPPRKIQSVGARGTQEGGGPLAAACVASGRTWLLAERLLSEDIIRSIGFLHFAY
jgi:hypothetical protein